MKGRKLRSETCHNPTECDRSHRPAGPFAPKCRSNFQLVKQPLNMTALAQWQIAVQQGEWSLVAPLLDQEELEVVVCWFHQSNSAPQAYMTLTLLVQFGKTLEKDLWPFDLHILGHIYNGEL